MNTHPHSQPMVKFVTQNIHSRSECEGSLVFTAICVRLREVGCRILELHLQLRILRTYYRACTHPCSRIVYGCVYALPAYTYPGVRKRIRLRLRTHCCVYTVYAYAQTRRGVRLRTYPRIRTRTRQTSCQVATQYSAAEYSAVSCYPWVSGSAATKLHDLARVHLRFLASLAVRVVRVARTGA